MTTDNHQGSENPLKEASTGREVRVDPKVMAALQQDDAIWRDLAAKCLQEVRDKWALEGSAQTEAAALRSGDKMTTGKALVLRRWWLGFRERFCDTIQCDKAVTNTDDPRLVWGASDWPEMGVTRLFCEAILLAKNDPDEALALFARVVELGDTCNAPERLFARAGIALMLKKLGRVEEAARAHDELAHLTRNAGICKLAMMRLANMNRFARAGEARCSAVQPSCPSGNKGAESRRHVSAICRSNRSSRSRPERRTR